MDIFRNPWKSNPINDPLISLTNLSSSPNNATNNSDRFLSSSFNSPSVHYPSIDNLTYLSDKRIDIQTARHKEIIQDINNPTSYLNILGKTCNIKSQKNRIKSTQGGYSSKIKRSGYLLHDQIMQSIQDASNDSNSDTVKKFMGNQRKIPESPYRILNAPRLKDDFYTNLLDWSPDDVVGVVLDDAAYIWSSRESDTEKIVEGYISCLKFNRHLILGEETGRIRIISPEKKREVSKYRSHQARVGCIDTYGENLLVSGSKDSQIMVWDLRLRSTIKRFQGHKQEVCGVKWSFDGNFIASGGNDNTVALWDHRAGRLYTKFTEHTAAVKALAWSPHQNSVLATGGGSTDKTIRIWNINEKVCTKKVDTGSQVCNMLYSQNSNELVSTHGFSLNSINVWNAKDMQKLSTLRGHSFRVLYLAKSPDGESIVSGSGDQTLRFWKIFPGIYNELNGGKLQTKNISIR